MKVFESQVVFRQAVGSVEKVLRLELSLFNTAMDEDAYRKRR